MKDKKKNGWIKFVPSLDLPKERVSIAYDTHDERGVRYAYGYFQFYNGTCGCFWKDGNEQPKVVKAEDIKYWMPVPSLDIQEEPVSEDLEEAALSKEWQGYVDRGAATVDALEDNTQELAFAKGFYRGWNYPKSSVWHDAKVKPLDGKDVLLDFKTGRLHIITTYEGDEYCINAFWIKFSEQKRWAYVEDLLKL